MEQKNIVKEYSNGEVTIVWKPGICIHSKMCISGLPNVFDFNARPWVNAQGATTQQIMDQVQKCPSGALSFYRNAEDKPAEKQPTNPVHTIEVMPNGPLLVHGNIQVKHADGTERHPESQITAFCRCGNSGNKPYCDGTHLKVGFQG